jgi:hypothetical protein
LIFYADALNLVVQVFSLMFSKLGEL